MTKQDFIDLLIINDAADDIADSISSVFGEIGEEGRFGELQCALSRLILRNASIYDPEKDKGTGLTSLDGAFADGFKKGKESLNGREIERK